jgi:arylsulfatase A-like enzyme
MKKFPSLINRRGNDYMNMLKRLLSLHTAVATGSLMTAIMASSFAAEPVQRPNLVIIMPDDLGWADVGFNQVESLRAERDDLAVTPEIDRLCAAGMRLNRFYVQPICTPTRAALMSGRYPWRSGMASGVILNHLEFGLPLDETTLAEVLREAGYGTYIIGKWHLGHHAAEYLPTERGFDYHYGLYMAIDHFTRYWQGGLDWHRNREPVREEGYATDLLADDIERIVAEHDFSERPMFLYHAMFAPHAWNQATEEYMAPFQHVENEGRRGLLGLLAAMDDAVMRTVRAFEKAGQLDNTLFLFFSDNGGPTRSQAINYPLRGSKGTYYEGGVRVAAFAYWPGRIDAGTSTDALLYVADVFPTFAALAGARLPEKTLDGFDLTPVLIGDEASTGRSEIVFILEDSERERRGAMIDWPWKLRRTAAPEGPWRLELYNLEDDPFESADGIQQARRMPELTQRLSNRLDNLKVNAPPAFWQQGDGRTPPGWRAPAIIGPDYVPSE